jgi:curved DNA-binding protein
MTFGTQGQNFTPSPDWKDAGGLGGEHRSSEGSFSDFFRAAFAGDSNSYSTRRDREQSFGQRGQDVQIDMPIFLEETLQETLKPVSYHLNGEDKNLKVKIPAGVTEGEQIRLKGQGEAGLGDAARGDLYLRIRLIPHPLFDVEHKDLIITVPLAPWEAALGGKVELPTITGKVRLAIPPGSQTGQRLRIRGQGLASKKGRGDLYAVLKIVIPETSNDIVKQHWQQLSEQASFDPRSEWGK